jgi:hypothetical protein
MTIKQWAVTTAFPIVVNLALSALLLFLLWTQWHQYWVLYKCAEAHGVFRCEYVPTPAVKPILPPPTETGE